MKPIIFHSEAEAELDDAAEWYEQQRTGLGEEFRDEVERAARVIGHSPASWQRFRSTRYRAFVVTRFPYVIYYEEQADVVRIMAVAQSKRRLGYWRHRS